MMNEFTYTPCYKSVLEAMPPDWYTSESMVLIMNMSRIKTPIRVYQTLIFGGYVKVRVFVYRIIIRVNTILNHMDRA